MLEGKNLRINRTKIETIVYDFVGSSQEIDRVRYNEVD